MRISLIILLAIVSVAAVRAESVSSSPAERLWAILAQKHGATNAYLAASRRASLVQRNQLTKTRTFTTGPKLTANVDDAADRGAFLLGHRLSYATPKYDVSTTIGQYRYGLHDADVQFNYVIASGLENKVKSLDSVIAVQSDVGSLQAESMTFQDFKSLLFTRVGYEYNVEEERLRREAALDARGYRDELSKLVAAGTVPSNSLQGLDLFIRDNELRVMAIGIERSLQLASLRADYGVDSALFAALSPDSVLYCFDDSAPPPPDYSWRLDSLNAFSQQVSFGLQQSRDWKLTAGVGTTINDYRKPGLYNNNLSLQYQHVFGSREPALRPRIAPPAPVPPSPVKRETLNAYREQALACARDARAWIGSTFARVKLGDQSSMYDVSQSLDVIVLHQMKYCSLWALFQQGRLTRLHSFSQLPPEWRPAP